jgi:RNA polymerase sigma factor (sigma-70 family)
VNDQNDQRLLRAYAERRSEAAFAELVRRHIDLVHSAAVRMVNDPHLAKDVSQGVFVALAKDAGKLTNHPVLSGWLHRTARNIAAQTVRTDVRRRHREEEAAAMNEFPETDALWEEISPLLDAALADLSEPDRDAILLRYFENKPAQEMATILGITAEAAQKRVSRAVERLRENFAKRGITAGGAGLAGVISAHAVQAAPAGLAASVSSAAFAGVSLTQQAILMNTLRKIAFGMAAAASITAAVYQSDRLSKLREQNAVQRELAARQDHRLERERSPESAARVAEGNSESAPAAAAGASGFMVMASVGGPSDPAEFSLFAPAGRGITTGAAEIAGLDAEQRKAVDKILRGAWKRMENDFASRAVEAKGDSAEMKVFSIPARSDGGSVPRHQLEAELDAAVGAAKREILMGGVRSSDFFGGFGALDFRFEFGPQSCSYRMTDPKSGEKVETGSMGYDSFIGRFGNSFETPKPEAPAFYR